MARASHYFLYFTFRARATVKIRKHKERQDKEESRDKTRSKRRQGKARQDRRREDKKLHAGFQKMASASRFLLIREERGRG